MKPSSTAVQRCLSSSRSPPLPPAPAIAGLRDGLGPEAPKSPDEESAKKETARASKPGVLPSEDDPAWDPFHAQQDIDVGTFYMHKGDIDAAI